MPEPTIQQIAEIHSVCQSIGYKFILDILEKELKEDIEARMDKADTLSGSLHGEWKMMRKVIRRLRGVATEYSAKWESRVSSNPSVLGAMSAGRIVEDDSSISIL